MSLPRSVNVNGTVYTVQYVAGSKKLEGAQGCTEFGKALISVDSGTSAERQREVLIHELAHACAEETGVHYLVSMLVEDATAQELVEEIYIRQMLPTLLATLQQASIIGRCTTKSRTRKPKKPRPSQKSTRRPPKR